MTVVSVDATGNGSLGLPTRQLVRMRRQQWVVSSVARGRQPAGELATTRPPGQTLVRLTSVNVLKGPGSGLPKAG